MEPEIKAERLVSFLEETIVYFMIKIEKIDRGRYFANRNSSRHFTDNPEVAYV